MKEEGDLIMNLLVYNFGKSLLIYLDIFMSEWGADLFFSPHYVF